MRSYWIWLLFMVAAWLCAWLSLPVEEALKPWRLVVAALFFMLYFIAPLLRNRPVWLTSTLIGASILATVALQLEYTGEHSLYVLLIYSLLAGKAIYRLPPIHAVIVGIALLSNLLAPSWFGYPSFPPMFAILLAAIHATGLAVYSHAKTNMEATDLRNDVLLSEYRAMKRRIVTNEKAARQEERTQIARDIHDSVGHKLTALLMQLEVLRMQADEQLAPRVTELKELARESLEETRSAVKSLKQPETGGLTAILNMIRKLEAEQFMRVHFTVQHGALSAPLSASQSFAVYRAVQEALTNLMKHSESKEAFITFEAPGGGIFRFEVVNRLKNKVVVREGFGLRSMRERIEEAGGTLEVVAYPDSFVIRGVMPILKEGGETL
ncbi:sensor histidine kinase [Paenibacillus camelliae]|uniref:sensor histidine kinase n=1 Tax=Paenibacillus camelliae TaxID=512410 RepID=UPI002041A719|nr:sensor histidine kinase [Paenibacillus camelliae]MCM3634947.1 sensor histidine kinase [Paenibacillus camelliae]